MDSSRRQDGTDYAILLGTGTGSNSAASGTGGSAASREESLALLPESTIGGIQVVRLIGCGKVSESWFGVDADQQREVVVKVLRKPWSADPKVLQFFERQLENVAALKHPNLANILQVGQENDMLFWITEWVKGGSVGPKVRRKGPLDIPSALRAIDQAATGLAYGQNAGVVHGGIKPENLLMERTQSVKISDLGVEFSARQLISGTPGATKLWVAEFMAPEVRSGAIPDVRSDIYSLGAVLLYLVAGVVPHDGLLDGTSPRITPALRELLIHMTAPSPSDRIQDYGRLRESLAEAEAGTLESSNATLPSNWLHDSGASTLVVSELETIRDEPEHVDAHVEVARISTPLPDLPKSIGAIVEVPAAPVARQILSDSVSIEPKTEDPRTDYEVGLDNEQIKPVLPGKPVPPRVDAKISPGKTRKAIADAKPKIPWVPVLGGILAVAGLSAGGTWYYVQKRLAAAAPPAMPAAAKAPAPQAVASPQPVAKARKAEKLAPAPPAVPVTKRSVASAPIGGPPVLPVNGMVAPAAMDEIIVDGSKETLKLEPQESWRASSETRDSYKNTSYVAQAGGPAAKATFMADVPHDGRYQVYLFWISRTEQLRSDSVPVTIHTAAGPINITIDQVNSPTGFNLIGTYNLKAGQHQPIVTISTDKVPNETGTVHVSADALKLTAPPN